MHQNQERNTVQLYSGSLHPGRIIFQFTRRPPYTSDFESQNQRALEEGSPSSSYFGSVSEVKTETGEIGLGVAAGQCAPIGWDHNIFYPTSGEERRATTDGPTPKPGYFIGTSGRITHAFTLPGGLDNNCFLLVKPKILIPSDNLREIFLTKKTGPVKGGFEATGDLIVSLTYSDGIRNGNARTVFRFLDKHSPVGTDCIAGMFSNNFEIQLTELIPGGTRIFSVDILVVIRIHSSTRYHWPADMEESHSYFKNLGVIDLRLENSRHALYTDTAVDGFEFAPPSKGCIKIPHITYEFRSADMNSFVHTK
ncbi:MAG: hypothetical protein V4722_24095 [Bacteroidota bacterium]